MVIVKSLRFWTLLVGLILFVIQAYVPSFPFGEDTILKLIVFVLGLLGIQPELKARGLI
jgi:membrane-bound ClpP family serine protease